METIQNNNIMSITQANQTKKDVVSESKIFNILYVQRGAPFIEIAQIYYRLINVLHVLKQ